MTPAYGMIAESLAAIWKVEKGLKDLQLRTQIDTPLLDEFHRLLPACIEELDRAQRDLWAMASELKLIEGKVL